MLKRVGMLLVLAAIMATVFPAAQAQDSRSRLPDEALARLSQGPLIHYWQTHPDQAPEQVGEALQSLQQASSGLGRQAATQTALRPPPGVGVRFNQDNLGLPQNEESITACRSNPNVVLGGTNDYRGFFIDESENTTGWHFSTNGGDSVRNEGLLPPLKIAGTGAPSGGDPVVVADASCNLYAGSLNFNPGNPIFSPNGVGVYRTSPEKLSSCTGGSDPACWPTRKAVAVAEPDHFLDKEWIYVGRSGSAGTVVWVVYTDFSITDIGFVSRLKAVRCSADLEECTEPILLSGDETDVWFGDVTIGPDGRTYMTWEKLQVSPEGEHVVFIHKLRVAPAGSTRFGPTRTIAVENQPLSQSGFLNANTFRVNTYLKNEVRLVGGEPRVFAVWDACREVIFNGAACVRPVIKLKTSDDLGASWSSAKVISKGGANYFPTISSDPEGPNVAIAYYTSRFDPRFDNRQDVELLTLDPRTRQVTNRQRLTSLSNEAESDPLLGGFFIGDYFEVFALRNQALVHFNANYRQIRVLESGLPVPQQDNYLQRTNLGQ
jgi:hypothetical protein